MQTCSVKSGHVPTTETPFGDPFEDDRPHDHCGVFGVWAPGEDVARLTYFGLYALQHRGQQSSGIATSDGQSLLVYKDQGLVNQVFSEETLQGLKGHIALGHVRYATTGADTWHNAQPTLGPTPTGAMALGHNGNLVNTEELRALAHSVAQGEDVQRGASTCQVLFPSLPSPALKALTPLLTAAKHPAFPLKRLCQPRTPHLWYLPH